MNRNVSENLREQRWNELVTIEYKYISDLFRANEEMGEKRVALFVSLSAGLGAAALVAKEVWRGTFPGIFLAVNVAWLLFGYLTFLRVVHRNTVTDKYKRQLRNLRQWFVDEGDVKVLKLIPYDPYGPPDDQHPPLRFFSGNGGYAELAGLINAIAAGAFGWQITHLALSPDLILFPDEGTGNWVALAVATVFVIITWKLLSYQAFRIYGERLRHELASSTESHFHRSQYCILGVGESGLGSDQDNNSVFMDIR